jgi:hypothetical protein
VSLCFSVTSMAHMDVVSMLWMYTPRPCFMPFVFNVPCEFVPLLHFGCLIFGLMCFGWFISIYLSLLFSLMRI